MIVHSLDRVGLDLRDLQFTIQRLNHNGTSVEFVQERLSCSPGHEDALSRLRLHLMGAFAEFERSLSAGRSLKA